jgi:hypothetical protein
MAGSAVWLLFREGSCQLGGLAFSSVFCSARHFRMSRLQARRREGGAFDLGSNMSIDIGEGRHDRHLSKHH